MLDGFRESHMLAASEQGDESLAGIVKLEYKTCKPQWNLLHKNTYALFFAASSNLNWLFS